MPPPVDIPAAVAAIRDTTYDTRVFTLLPHVAGYPFAPGQHCLVDVGLNRPRPFSFSSSPLQQPGFEMAIKRAGVLTEQLFRLRVGDTITISRPLSSRFSLAPGERHLAMVAGGTGITPFMSIIRDAVWRKLPTRLTLVFANKTAADIIYGPELAALAAQHPALTLVFTLTQAWPEGWTGERGRIDGAMLRRHVADVREPRWLLCGPPPMVVALRRELVAFGVIPERIAV